MWLTALVVGSEISLAADPDATDDGLHLANVTLHSALAPDLVSTVRVSLYKLGKTISVQSNLTTFADGGVLPARAMDPLRPRIYVGATSPLLIEGYDIYTGEKVLSTVPPMPDQRIWKVSRDGRFLMTRQSAINPQTGIDELGPTVMSFDIDSETWLAPTTVNSNADLPHHNLGGIELSRSGGFADTSDQPYVEIAPYQPSPLDFTHYFADPAQRTWFIETERDDGMPGQIVALDAQVYVLAHKITYNGMQTGAVPRLGLGSNTRDFTNQGHRIWSGYGWLDYDPVAGFGQFHPLQAVVSMLGGTPEEFSMNEQGEALVLWFGESVQTTELGFFMTHYDANGAVTRVDRYNADAVVIGGFDALPRAPDGLVWITSLFNGGASGFGHQITSQ